RKRKRLIMAELRIREMESSDIEAVMEIDEKTFNAPWNKRIFDYEINENKFSHNFIVETNQIIIGYIGLWIVYEDAKITIIYILEEYRGFKIGEHIFSYDVICSQNQRNQGFS